MNPAILVALSIIGSFAASFIAATKNRDVLVWFVVGAICPVFSAALVYAIEPLGPDGLPVARCCPHCPCRKDS